MTNSLWGTVLEKLWDLLIVSSQQQLNLHFPTTWLRSSRSVPVILERMWLCCSQGSRYSRQIKVGGHVLTLWDLISSEWGREDDDRYGLHPYKFKFEEPKFTNQPAGDCSVLSPAGFRSTLIHTQQAPPRQDTPIFLALHY